MPDDGLPSLTLFSAAPFVDSLRQPLIRFIQRTTQPRRRTADGLVYLGDGQPVIVFPHFGMGAESTWRLRLALSQAGFSVHDWGLGADSGPGPHGLGRSLRRMEEQLIDVFERERCGVTLLGWSLSGIYARELAKRATPLVRQVITLSTPFRASSDLAHAPSMVRALADATGHMDAALVRRMRQRPPVPCTSIYSTDDSVVPWELCVESDAPDAENIALPGVGHFELPVHPRALEAISRRLAQPEDDWRPLDA